MSSPHRDWLVSRGLLFFGVFMAVIVTGALGFLIYASLSPEPWATVWRTGGGTLTISAVAILGTVGAVGGFWGYRRTKRRVLDSTKYELLKIVSRKGVTDKQAAKELKVGTWVIKESLRELKKEGAVE